MIDELEKKVMILEQKIGIQNYEGEQAKASGEGQ